jgi:nitrite reductase/ring-hydroxylating ferredoxin subunit
MRVADLAEGKPQMAECNGTPIFLLKRGEEICAISETCSHAGGPLHEGTIEDNVVICPWHASRFDIRTGAVRGGPATVPQVRYDVRIQDGRVEVRRSPATLQPN